MKIAVISPLHGQTGNSTCATAIALSLSLSQKRNICLTHSDFGTPVLSNMLGLELVDDPTRSLSHVAKLLQTGMVSANEVPDYAIQVFPGLDLYTTNKVSLAPSELVSFYEFLLDRMNVYSHVVIDVDTGIRSDIASLILSMADVIVVPVSQNIDVLRRAYDFKEEIRAKINTKKKREVRIVYMLNHYDSSILTYKKVAKSLDIKPSQLMTLRRIPVLIKSSNNGTIADSFAGALRGHKPLASVRADMKSMCKILLGKEFTWNIK